MASMIEKLAINVNGSEKYATGLTKSTTIDDIKFAMLTATSSSSTSDAAFCMDDFGVFERWQGNERLLDGRVKIHKLVRVWQSLPGDQLSQVQFLIKRKRAAATTAALTHHRHHHQQQQQQQLQSTHKSTSRCANNNESSSSSKAASFALCTLSPDMRKTWNYEKLARKSSYVNRQLRLVAAGGDDATSSTSSDEDESLSSSSSFGVTGDALEATRRRYASIKRYHRSKRSSIKKCSSGGGQMMKSAYVGLIDKQTEIIERQMHELAAAAQQKQSAPAVFASSKKIMSEQEAAAAAAETKKLFDDYLNVEMCLESKLAKIEQLTSELNSLVCGSGDNKPADHKLVAKTTRRLAASIELDRKQADKLKSMDTALEHMDDIITLKQKSVETLENELKLLEELSLASTAATTTTPASCGGSIGDNEMVMTTRSSGHRFAKSSSTSSTASNQSSTSSLFTSISSISSQSSLHNYQAAVCAAAAAGGNVSSLSSVSANKSCHYGNDNESDTGISSANSEDFSTHQLETLV